MVFDSLLSRAGELIERMLAKGYSPGYVRTVSTEIAWLRRNGDGYDSYESACAARESQTDSKSVRRSRRIAYGILKRFDLEDAVPERGHRDPLRERSAYHRLDGEFKRVADACAASARAGGLAESSVGGYVLTLASFLDDMRAMGRSTLAEITEEDVLARFTDDAGGPAYSATTTGRVIRTLSTSDLGDLSEAARRVASYVPHAKSGRKNVQFLRPEESDAVRAAVSGDLPGLDLRGRAIGAILFYTGMRACDVAALTLGDIDWEVDEIRITQQKTGEPLTLPLTAAVGNALYDYILEERPASDDPHVFLASAEPHRPLTVGGVRSAARHIYDAAGIRANEGDRRGTHLFRHNVATTVVATGANRAVASAILGHASPDSLDRYLSADIEHLRRCALDVSRFPVREGVFDV